MLPAEAAAPSPTGSRAGASGRHAHLDLAVVGNCEISALIDAHGRLVWMCLPRPDGDPTFCALLTPELGAGDLGVFAFDLVDCVRTEQRYLRNSAVVETILYGSSGAAVRIVDFCPRYRARGRMFRPMMLVRLVEPLAGRPVLRPRLKPAASYGRRGCAPSAGSHHLRYECEGASWRITTDASITALLDCRTIVLEEPLTFLLGPDATIDETPRTLARSFLEETLAYWQDWVRALAIPFDWQDAVIRAAITLKLCTYEDTGAVLAALTTSIPEFANSGRNWDYRYCWLRDSYFVVQALNRLGTTRTMEGYLHYIDRLVTSVDVVDLQPLYRISGDSEIPERIVDSLPGFLGMGPVRVGNQAAEQVQRDVYGAVILAVTQLFFDERLMRPGDAALFKRLEALGVRAVRDFERPDAGPWELRGSQHVHTFSAAMSWAGCDRLARIAARLGITDRAQYWGSQAMRLRESILDRAWHPARGVYTGAFGGADLDATVLLLPELGLVDARDARFRATLDLIGRELRDGDLMFRYRQADDFGRPETAFTICAFWYVSALAAAGERDAAREHFTRLLEHRNPLGLLSEDIDPITGSHWGNYPQTYSLVGVINSALRLSRSWEDAL